MPYLTQEARTKVIDNGFKATQAGELNYVITLIIKEYWQHDPRYQTANDIVGALECAKQEFIRRIVNPYEDEKIRTNGDVY